MRLAILVFMFLVIPTAKAINESWNPPPSIPRPSFGVTNDIWIYTNISYTYNYGAGAVTYRVDPTYGPYTHWIDKGHPSAADGTNSFGTPTKPRLTVPAGVAAGSIVDVWGGGTNTAYTFSNTGGGRTEFSGDATLALPTFFRGLGHSTNQSELPLLSYNGTVFYIWANNSIIEGFRWTNTSSVGFRPELKGAPITNAVVRNNYFIGNSTSSSLSALTAGGSTGASSSNYLQNITIFSNEIYSYGDRFSTNENDATGLIFGEYTTNCWILRNNIYFMGGDGIRIGADQGHTPSGQFYYVAQNHLHDNRENALDIKQAYYAVVAENIMHGFAASSSSAGEAIVSHYNPRNIWIINNTIYDSVRGVNSTELTGENMYVKGNVIYNCDRALYEDRGGGTFHNLNNTMVNCGYGEMSTGTIDMMDNRNNCIVTITNFSLQLDNSTARAATTISNENFYGTTVSLDWGSTTYSSVASFITGTGKGAGSMQQDPLFTDQAAHNYNLLAGSPLINAGVSLVSVDTDFKTVFNNGSITILTDINGTTIPQGNAPEIGAYEYTPPSVLNNTIVKGTTLKGTVIIK